MEYHDAEGEITEKSDRVIEKGMAFVVRVGLQKLRAKSEGNDEREYAILLADTILIGANGAAEVLTDKCTKKYSEVSYELGSAESAEEEAPKQRKSEKYDPLWFPKLCSSYGHVILSRLDYGELTGFSLFKDEKLDAVEVGGRKLRNTVQRELLNTATVHLYEEKLCFVLDLMRSSFLSRTTLNASRTKLSLPRPWSRRRSRPSIRRTLRAYELIYHFSFFVSYDFSSCTESF